MKRVTGPLKALFRDFKNKFFLRKHSPKEYTLELLRTLYPSVDWRRVDFYEGLPWFTPLVAPYVTAQALPRFYSFGGFRIYLKKFDESRPQCLADIVHEGFHIMQSMHFAKGYGLGFLRGLMVYYNAYYATHGYRANPFEEPAYDQEFRFLELCRKHGIHGIIDVPSPPEIIKIAKEQSLVFPAMTFRFKGNPFALAGSALLCFVIALARPVADVLVWSAGTIYSLATRTQVHPAS
jgi:hypothetical protein